MIMINGVGWRVVPVPSFHTELFRGNGSRSVGVCDNYKKIIYIDQNLDNEQFKNVLIHELTHAILFSYKIKIDLDIEELLANEIEKNREV